MAPHSSILAWKTHGRWSLVGSSPWDHKDHTTERLHFTSIPSGSDSKESACNTGDQIPSLGQEDSPAEGNGYLVQYSCLENYMDRETCQAAVHGVAKSWTQLSS